MWPFEWNHILALFYDSVVCFLLPKCVFLYQGVFDIYVENFNFIAYISI